MLIVIRRLWNQRNFLPVEQLPKYTEKFPAADTDQRQQQEAGGRKAFDGEKVIETKVSKEEQEGHAAKKNSTHRRPGMADINSRIKIAPPVNKTHMASTCACAKEETSRK